jgi:thiol-disulfide isomerase/thioredoxin
VLERLLIALLLVAAAFGAYAISTRRQTGHLAARDTGQQVLGQLQRGVPAVIYFWSEACAPCKLVQKPALADLADQLGPQGVQIVAINAMDDPALADGWGVLSLPTTFIVDATGQVRHVNHGVMRAAQLRGQIEQVA